MDPCARIPVDHNTYHMNSEHSKKSIISFLQKYCEDKPAVLGLSGGLDSSVVAYLAAEALGSNKIHTIISPSETNTDQDLEYAKNICENLDIQYSIFNIDTIIESFQKSTDNLYTSKQSLGNLKARIRMSLLYGKANELDGLVLGTGNRTELSIGYFTKHGDGGADLLPIGDLYKTEERELAKYIGVPQEIIDRPPTAGLWDGQTDEDEIGMTYETLDKILTSLEQNKSLDKFETNDVEKVRKLMNKATHKNKIPPICKL